MRMLMVIVIIFPFMALRSCLLSSPKSTSDRKCLKENLKRRKTLTQRKDNEVIIASQSS